MFEILLSKIWIIIGTILIFFTKLDYFKNKKFIYIVLTIFSFVSNGLFVLHPENAWTEKIYAGLLIIIGVFNFIDIIKYKKPKESTFVIDDNASFSLDNKKMFEDALVGAQNGDLMSICNLGYFYRNGTGTNINLKKSREMFSKLSVCDNEFWREEGKKELAITEKMIKEKKKEMRDVIKDGIESISS